MQSWLGKRSPWVLNRSALVSCLALPVLSFAQPHSEEELHAPFKEAATGVIFPMQLGVLGLREKVDYGEPVTSSSVGYDSSDGAKADVYFYGNEQQSFPSEKVDLLQVISDEVGSAAGAILEFERRGYYQDVVIPEHGSVTEFGGDENPLQMVSIEATYRQVSGGEIELALGKGLVESLFAVTLFRDRFFKIRYTFRQWDEKVDQERREERELFMEELRSVLIEVELREELPDRLKTFFADPLSEGGSAAGDFAFAYAEISPLPQIMISMDWLPFLSDYDVGESPVGRALLLGFIAGNLEKQVSSGDFSYQSRAGVEGSLRVYRHLRASGAAEANARLDEWIVRQDTGTLGEWMDAVEEKAEREAGEASEK